MRSSPNSAGHGESPATQSVAGNGLELTLVARQLLALGRDDVGRRVLDEALVRELLLGPRDLPAQPLALGLDVAVRLLALGLDDDLEDAPLVVALQWDEHAAPPEGRRS